MTNVSNRLSALLPSQTLAMTQLANNLKAQGIDVISLSVGEPDFNTPDYVKEAAKKAIDDNCSFYSPVQGFNDLLEAIVNKLKRDNSLEYTKSQIVVSNGAKQAITNVFLSLLNPGDEVLIPTPYWVTYPEAVKLAEAKPVYIPASIETDFKVTAEQIKRAITPKTKMFVFSSPSNPSGSVYTKEELSEIAEVFAKNPQILILSDEIYEHIVFEGTHQSIAQFSQIKDQVIVVNGVSKGYAMTGWRIGYIAAAEWIAKACIKLQGQYTSGACSIAQKAATAALNGGVDYPREMNKAFKRRRDFITKELGKIEGVKTNTPQGAFYIFPDISYFFGKSCGNRKIKTASDLSMYLLEEAHVATVSGEGFGNPECIRLSYATSDENIKEACNRIKAALSNLK